MRKRGGTAAFGRIGILCKGQSPAKRIRFVRTGRIARRLVRAGLARYSLRERFELRL
jgi:hypothetical protein